DTLLDVGCGDGWACRTAGMAGADVIGLDVERAYVERTTAAMLEIPARSFRGILSDANPIPLPDATASAGVCSEVLEHVDDPAAFLAELVRVGKPGARYMLAVPGPESESLMKIVAPDWYFQKPGHLRIFQRDQLQQLVREAGLQIERRETI